MIDLSFLTEEEQEAILAVLKRDAELKKAEEKRVQKLQQNVTDKSQLRYLTGEWFYETKQLRHQERIHGSEIIWASMKRTHKPMTILELSQIVPERPSFVSSENKDVFVPAVLSGLLQEPRTHLCNTWDHAQSPYELQEPPKPVVQSPTRQRRNPFNSEPNEPLFTEEKDKSADGAEHQPIPQSDEYLSPSHIHNPDDALQNLDHLSPICPFIQKSVLTPVPEESMISIMFDEPTEVDGSEMCIVPRGILKSISSSSDSPQSQLDSHSPVSTEPLTEPWMDRKQVRFSPAVGCSSVKCQDGKELGEHSLLDVDLFTPSQAEINSDPGNKGACKHTLKQTQVSSAGSELNHQGDNQHQVIGDQSETCQAECHIQVSSIISTKQDSGKPVHLETEPEEDHHPQTQASEWSAGHDLHLPQQTLSEQCSHTTEKQVTNDSSKSSSHAISPKPKPRFLGILKKEKLINTEVLKEELKETKQKEVESDKVDPPQAVTETKDDQNANLQKPTPLEKTDVRTVLLTAIQNTPFNKSVASADAPSQEIDDRAAYFPESLANLKAFGEKENNGPNILFTRETGRHEATPETKKESSQKPQNVQMKPDVETINSNDSEMKQTEKYGIEENPAKNQGEIGLPRSKCNVLIEVSNEEDTYRAFPVLIYEDDDSLTVSVTESQICEQKPNQYPVPPPRQLGSSSQEGNSAKVVELKKFWEACTAPGTTAGIAMEAPGSPVQTSKVFASESELKTLKDVVQISPSKTNSFKPFIVNEKGFVNLSLGSSPLISISGNGDIHKAWQQVKEGTDFQNRPHSPSKSPTKRSKDQDDEVRQSPSKTYHPRVLPRESTSPIGTRPEESPLKIFPIDLEGQPAKPTPVPRQKKNPTHESKQTFAQSNLPIHPVNKTTHVCSENIHGSPEKKLGTNLARSFVPQDYQYYLGPQEKAHVPPFQQRVTEDTDALHRPQSAHRDFVGNQSESVTKDPRVSSWIEQIKDSSQDTATRAWSLSRASSGSYDDKSSPGMSALKRLSSKMSSSKSLENITSQTREENVRYDSQGQINRSVDDVSGIPSTAAPFANSKKSSVSVPDFQLDGTDRESPFENNLSSRRNTGSSTNISLSSGLASMSSVSGSMTSINQADFGDIDVQGTIQFAVNYIQKLGEFHIFVVHCRDLAVADTKKKRSDPYVKCYLLPDKTKFGKRKTTVKKKTVNPTYNEILRFKITMEVLKTQTLNISVWHNDTFGHNSFLGEVDFDLGEWDFSNTRMNEYALKARTLPLTTTASPSRSVESKGQMRVALRFLPQTSQSKRTSNKETGEVQIWVKDCKNLPPIRGVIIDPFVKCTVLPDTSRKSRQKTRVVKRTANPMFNHTMVYDGFRPEDLREACVEITVWDHDRLNNHYIGGLRLGLGTRKSYGVEVNWMDSTTNEANLWQRMLESNGEWVEDVLPLRMLLMAKTQISK